MAVQDRRVLAHPFSAADSAPPSDAAGQSPRILVVDAEPAARRLLRALLLQSGYQVELAASGAEAAERLVLTAPAAILLDPSLPDGSGLELCQQLREWNDLPLIVVSADSAEASQVAALDVGADDYVTKPFGHEELLARLRAVLRRAPREAPPPVLESGPLRLDQARRQVTRNDSPVHLTPTEYELLRYLMTNAGKTITYATLVHAIWGEAYGEARATVRVFIAQLRRKIEPDSDRPTFIQTIPQVGYFFAAPVQTLK
jgi:two-component system, OmpR family, KDP operon response regulator KdpE